MITLVISVEETGEGQHTVNVSGTIVGFGKPTMHEENMMKDLLDAVQDHCMRRRISGSTFVRADWPGSSTDGNENERPA